MTPLGVSARFGVAAVHLNTRDGEPQTLEVDGLTYQLRSLQSLIDLHRCLTVVLAGKTAADD